MDKKRDIVGHYITGLDGYLYELDYAFEGETHKMCIFAKDLTNAVAIFRERLSNECHLLSVSPAGVEALIVQDMDDEN